MARAASVARRRPPRALLRVVSLVVALASAGLVQADAASLRGRIASLAEEAERAGVSDTLDVAVRALVEADRRRGQGDVAGARRSEALAEAAVTATDRALAALAAARVRAAAVARVDIARARLERGRARRRGEALPSTSAPSEGAGP